MTFLRKPGSLKNLAMVSSLLALPTVATAEWGLNLPRGVTPYSRTIYDLHMLILWICFIVGVVVFGLMFYSIIKFRKSQGAQAAQWHESTKVEVAWTLVPFVILVAIAVPATKALIMMEDVSNSDMTIKVTGYQWKWHYQYIDEGLGFFSTLSATSNEARQRKSGIDPKSVDNYLLEVDNHLIVPINKKIRFLTTAGDVIHAWWVPALGWKRDAIPGFINESWAIIEEPGVYRGQCAELCGKDHGFMPIVVEALPQAEFDAWVEKMQSETQQAKRAAPTTATDKALEIADAEAH
ncbi:MAG: cytochrome c oxidase subunit II [Gammaproteobacteria bacterium]